MSKLQGASKVGESFMPGQEPELAPGVRGVLFDKPDEVIIPVVYAEDEGSGAVGKWLDSLPTDRTVTFSTVLSGRLTGMLKRRGFQPATSHDPDGNPYDVLRRLAVKIGDHVWEELANDHAGGSLSWCSKCGTLKRWDNQGERGMYRRPKTIGWSHDEPECGAS